MFESLVRGWRMFKVSFSILMEDKKLMAFPTLSALFSVLLLIGFIAPFAAAGLLSLSSETIGSILLYVVLFFYYLCTSFLAVFFNVALVHSIKSKLAGRPDTLGASLGFAASRFSVILQWAIISAVVGIILRAIERAGGRNAVGRIIAGLVAGILGVAWSILTFFVIPVLVYENLGVVDTLKKSAGTFKKTWGEITGAGIGSGFVFIAIGMLWVVVCIVLAVAVGAVFPLWALGVLVLFVLGLVVLGIMSSAVSTVSNTLLYIYASQGVIPPGFEEDEVKKMFSK